MRVLYLQSSTRPCVVITDQTHTNYDNRFVFQVFAHPRYSLCHIHFFVVLWERIRPEASTSHTSEGTITQRLAFYTHSAPSVYLSTPISSCFTWVTTVIVYWAVSAAKTQVLCTLCWMHPVWPQSCCCAHTLLSVCSLCRHCVRVCFSCFSH